MIDTIYLENEISDHPRVRNVIDHFPQAVIIPCERYGEIFNRRSQDFRLQKQQPALLLPRKHDGWVRHWWDEQLLFFTHAELHLRLPLLFFAGHVSVGQLCGVC